MKNKRLKIKKNKPYKIFKSNGTNRVIILCDHASNYIPPKYKNLGDNLIAPTVLSRAFLSGVLGGLIGMMNGVVLCQNAAISLDDFKDIYMDRNSIEN